MKAMVEKVRVLHFVTGGFSGGATQIAIALVNAALQSERVQPLLVLRRKRRGTSGRAAGSRPRLVTCGDNLEFGKRLQAVSPRCASRAWF